MSSSSTIGTTSSVDQSTSPNTNASNHHEMAVEDDINLNENTSNLTSSSSGDLSKKRARSSYENISLQSSSVGTTEEDEEDDRYIDDEDEEDEDTHHRRKTSSNKNNSNNNSSSSSSTTTGTESRDIDTAMSPKRVKLSHNSGNDASSSNNSNTANSNNNNNTSASSRGANTPEDSEEHMSSSEDRDISTPDSSKERKDGEVGPSKVLFLRNLPPNCEEAEIESITSAYDCLEIVILRSSRQAFVEFATVEQASKFLESVNGAFQLRDRQVYVTYSDRQEIQRSGKEEKPNNLLLATLSNVMYPITVDVLHQVFSRYGDVDKIVVFTKNNNTQGLIQFADVQAATAAKAALDGQNIYQNCCKLRIVYSKMKDLNVKFNNDRTRDYTNPNLPAEPAYTAAPVRAPPPPSHFYPPAAYGGGYPHVPPYGMPPMPYRPETPVLYVRNLDSHVTCDHLFILFGVYGDVERVKILLPPKSAAMIEFTNPYGADVALTHLSRGCPLFGSVLSVSRSNHYNINTPRGSSTDSQFKDYHNSPLHRFKRADSKNYNHICPPSRSLHVSNIHGSTTEDEIKNVFGKYGEVQEVRFFGAKTARTSDNKEIENKMAIIQLVDLDSAIKALIELHDHKLNGLSIKVTFSERRRGGGGGGEPRSGAPPPHGHHHHHHHHHGAPPPHFSRPSGSSSHERREGMAPRYR